MTVGQHLSHEARRLAASSISRTARSIRSAWRSIRWATCIRAIATAGRSISCCAGAWYPSFGKPHDGLGFGPEMMTARSRLDGHRRHRLLRRRPVSRKDYRDTHLHRQRRHQPRSTTTGSSWHGSTPKAIEQPDFCQMRRPLVPPGRHQARPRRLPVRRRLLQPDHRPLRSAAEPSRPRPRTRPDLADRLSRPRWRSATAAIPRHISGR